MEAKLKAFILDRNNALKGPFGVSDESRDVALREMIHLAAFALGLIPGSPQYTEWICSITQDPALA